MPLLETDMVNGSNKEAPGRSIVTIPLNHQAPGQITNYHGVSTDRLWLGQIFTARVKMRWNL